MNDNLDRFHSRKHPRIPHYDYSQPNYYFVTICTKEKHCIFGKAGSLNWRGNIAEEGIFAITKHFPSVLIDKYVVMPNHIHAIVILQQTDVNLTTVIGQYKAHVSRKIHEKEPERTVWQTSFHDHVIRNQQSYEKIWLYIDANPANWEKDCFFSLTAKP